MSSELFLLGDARYLSGGFRAADRQSYQTKAVKLDADSPRVDEEVALKWFREHKRDRLDSAINHLVGTAVVSSGRSGYHSSQTVRRQVFLMKDDPLPSAGVELEFISDATGDRVYEALKSNWFSLERDGSLPSDSGHELVTVPLPATKYLDPRLWAGLHNLLAPYAASASSDATGFHVHVGLDVFDSAFTGAPKLLAPVDRRRLGALTVLTCYYALLPQDFLSAVYGRGNGPFRNRTFPDRLAPVVAALRRGGMTAGSLVDAVAWTFAAANGDALAMAASHLRGEERPAGGRGPLLAKNTRTPACAGAIVGHQTEINVSPEHTVEFRRGKGTLNPEAMLRMTDFSTLCVRYAAHLATYPGETPSTRNMMKFIAGHATSGTLRELAAGLADDTTTNDNETQETN